MKNQIIFTAKYKPTSDSLAKVWLVLPDILGGGNYYLECPVSEIEVESWKIIDEIKECIKKHLLPKERSWPLALEIKDITNEPSYWGDFKLGFTTDNQS